MGNSNTRLTPGKKRPGRDTDAGSQRKKMRYPLESAFTYKSAPVTVIVGEEQTAYFVHESHITPQSDFFKNALKGEWEEKTTRTVRLPDCDSTSFNIYLNWLYTGRVCITQEGDEKEVIDDDVQTIDYEWENWVMCFKIGDFLQDSDFKDAMIDAAIEKLISENIDYVEIPVGVYTFSQPTSRNRRLAVDLALNVWEEFRFQYVTNRNYPPEFLTDLITAMGGKLRAGSHMTRTNDFLRDIDTCEYHEHTTIGTPCCKTKRGI
ncbi:uncharacterized protein EKO05_0007088 [Ascochyta rabiei]|uniref:Uncharacterized protein n=1 Tax=Didymella rabiei TaxID=5454 RepID=A0A163G2M2_DIDRA|nr:uncharacterized protein EKO05_0007088 [Ascochyta rabiei]KZM24652.1 hypothetical protein ST47_g4163 [Ascochyta rabiei]UPX16700.1 hypothetical protein EKO05_0007088 [Ascochyta rabiei]